MDTVMNGILLAVWLQHQFRQLDFSGLAIDTATVDELLAVDNAAWRKEATEIGSYLESYGGRLPAAMREELARLMERLTPA